MKFPRKLSGDERMLFREYHLRVARKANPGALVDVEIDDYTDQDGRVTPRVTIVAEETDA